MRMYWSRAFWTCTLCLHQSPWHLTRDICLGVGPLQTSKVMGLPRSHNFVTLQDDGLASRVMILGACSGTQLVTFYDDAPTPVSCMHHPILHVSLCDDGLARMLMPGAQAACQGVWGTT